MTQLSVSLLGGFEARLNGALITEFATDKARALLAYLAVEAQFAQPRSALAGLLWPDQPDERARQSLRQALSLLRQALHDEDDHPAPLLLVGRELIQFNAASDCWLDVAEFRRLAEERRAHRHRTLAGCLPCLRRAERMAKLYRGSFLDHFALRDSGPFEEWATLEREWLQREMVQALGELTAFYTRRGETGVARDFAYRQVALDPWREESHGQLMRLLALDGQRSAALAQFEVCRRALAGELGIAPARETQALYRAIRDGALEPAPAPGRGRAPGGRLQAPVTPFVGREAELEELAAWLADPDCRLVTLLGAGGVGKTRLALQAAHEQNGAWADGVWFVPLAAAGTTEAMVFALADALGLPLAGAGGPQAQLVRQLRDRELLLVLDNLEYLPEAGVLLGELLDRAPGAVLLVASRARLNLREETVFAVEGLTYPGEGDSGWESYSALRLFEECVRRSDRRLALSVGERQAVARICQLVDGMPLAVELAAAWVPARSCAEVAADLERSLDVLTSRVQNVPERQRSVRATFEYSWQALSAAEQALLARLSIFRGGFTRAAAASVTGATPAALSALLEVSLLRPMGAERCELHELLRQFAAEKLAARPGEREQAALEHGRYYAAQLGSLTPLLQGAREKQALDEIALETGNLRLAWQNAVARGDADQVARTLDGVYEFHSARSRFEGGVQLLGLAVERWRDDPAQELLLGRLLARQGALTYHLGELPLARARLERGLALADDAGQAAEALFCLVHLANVVRAQGAHAETEPLATRALELARQLGQAWGTARALFVLSTLRQRAGDLPAAERFLEESLAVCRASESPRLVMTALNALADVRCHLGDWAGARELYAECLTLSRALEDPLHVAIHLNNLGTLLHVLQRYEEAGKLYGESLELCVRIGDRSGQAIALSNLGEIAHVRGDDRAARDCYRQGLAIGRAIQEPEIIATCLNNLGEVSARLGDEMGARASLAEALALAAETRDVALLLKGFITVAEYFAQRGRRELSADLAALTAVHPASERMVQERAGRLLQELGRAAGGETRGLDALAAAAAAALQADEGPTTQR